jgi:uncharacterized membrane protein
MRQPTLKSIRREGGDAVLELTGRRLLRIAIGVLVSIKLLQLIGTVWEIALLPRAVLAIVFLTFVPGLFVLTQFDYHAESVTTTACYAFGLSLALVMFTGAVMSLVLPALGIMHPLSLDWLLGTWMLLSGILAWNARYDLTLRVPEERFTDPKTLFLLLFFPTAILGTVLYKTTGNNVVLLGLLITIATIPVVVALRATETWYFPLVVWSIALGLLYHGVSLGSYTITQPLPQVTMENLRWIPNYADGLGTLLGNGVLFPTYAVVSGLPLAVEWSLVNTFLVSFLPVVLYQTFRRYVADVEALLSVFLFMSAYSFYVLYPGAGRAATPVIFIALSGLDQR